MVERVGQAEPDRRITTRHGDAMLLTDFQVTRVVELAVHGLDLADALGREPWLTAAAADVVEALLFGTSAAAARSALGVDRATLIRKATGRSDLTEDERAELDRRAITWLTLA